ncbi:ubiquitin-conjugating enzyme E2 J1-like [Bacillus rossius redtenbacheri]|uniref:ubiquitin-conjugating enzyme E2 J1-like n=1 Tax=Bacillus rossius redtenbacheri TaxID=93214 RepID=UPI002FDEF8CC
MDTERKYNIKSPAVKRLMREACELKDATGEYWACPLEDNLFEWHFTVRGPPDTDFSGGVYHGRILLPTEYPMKPPNIILLTPNGRFETNKKICLSISDHHPETWQPSWSIRTALLALIAFMPTPGTGTIGSLDYTPEERRTLARRSVTWECPTCGKILHHLSTSSSEPPTKEEAALISQISLKGETTRPEPADQERNTSEQSFATAASSADGDDGMRQRMPTAPVRELSVRAEDNAPPQLVQMNSRSESYKNLLMWFLIGAISLLVYRRLFLV